MEDETGGVSNSSESDSLIFGLVQNLSSSLGGGESHLAAADSYASIYSGGGLSEIPSLSPVLAGPGPGLIGTSGNETMLSSYWPLRDPLSVVIPITVIYIIILVVGLLGNIVTCVVIVRSRYLHTATNYYLFSLAISDLLLLLSGLPAEMHSIWRRYPDVFGEVFCIGRGLASETSANATVLTITAFTVERYLAICRPFFIQKWQNKLSRIVKQILVIWAISIALAIPQVRRGLVDIDVITLTA
jgi:hypothetical protein